MTQPAGIGRNSAGAVLRAAAGCYRCQLHPAGHFRGTSPHTPHLRRLTPAGAVATGAPHQRVAVVSGASGATCGWKLGGHACICVFRGGELRACYRRPALLAAHTGRSGRYRSTAPAGHRGCGRYRGTVRCLLQEACYRGLHAAAAAPREAPQLARAVGMLRRWCALPDALQRPANVYGAARFVAGCL
ncbi:hypothetical protein COCOBI_02-8090 [Coccomyxa sp. Obi]|nr:hypothetical protein COCOBI_02-8090 [Coccomyxa sp. Obi]